MTSQKNLTKNIYALISIQVYYFFYLLTFFLLTMFIIILTMKKTISTPLMREKPVRRPMVPPIADNLSENLAARS